MLVADMASLWKYLYSKHKSQWVRVRPCRDGFGKYCECVKFIKVRFRYEYYEQQGMTKIEIYDRVYNYYMWTHISFDGKEPIIPSESIIRWVANVRW